MLFRLGWAPSNASEWMKCLPFSSGRRGTLAGFAITVKLLRSTGPSGVQKSFAIEKGGVVAGSGMITILENPGGKHCWGGPGN